MRILVTDGNSRAALAICRSLGKKGHEIIIGHNTRHCLASTSRYCKGKCIYPDPCLQPDTFIRFIKDYASYAKIDCLIPVTDITTIPIIKHKEVFEPECKVPFANYGSIDKAANKLEIFNIANSLSVDTPQTIVINNTGDLSNLKINFPFPVVIKPSRSRVYSDTGWIYTSVSYAESFEHLSKQLKSFDKRIFPVLIQERIKGPGLGIFMLYQDGMPIAAFSHKRIREKPPSGGISVYRKSIPLDPVALEFSEKLLTSIKWQGVAMVEFKVDERDNRPKLMEINGRFWGSLQLAIDSGVDFPALLIDSLDRDIEPNYNYDIGVKTRWLWGDVDALIMRLLKSDTFLQLPPGSPGKLSYLLSFCRFWEPKLHYEILNFSDINPWFFETYHWIKDSLRI